MSTRDAQDRPLIDSGRSFLLVFSIENRLNYTGTVDVTAKEVPKRLGAKLKAIRLYLGYTMDQMAEAVGKRDQSRRSRVYEWENGIRQPDLASLLAYARLAGVSTDVLIDDESELKLGEE
jgi:DNA-binding XRE family transcriptional regulator